MEDKYKIIFFIKSNGQEPIQEYLEKIPEKDKIKIIDYINKLSIHAEFRREPYSRHLDGKLRELKIDFSKNRHRVIYFFNVGKFIILLHVFTKKSQKIPKKEISKAKNYMQEFLANQ